MVEVTSFTLMALFIARQGTLASAAHQVAANLAAVLYMVPLSLAIATSARVSLLAGRGGCAPGPPGHPHRFQAGAGDGAGPGRHRRCSAAGASPLSIPATREVVALAAGLLAWLAVYHLGDAVQALCVFVLRCYRVAIAPLVAYCAAAVGRRAGRWLCTGLRGPGALARAEVARGLLGRRGDRARAAGPYPASDSVAGGTRRTAADGTQRGWRGTGSRRSIPRRACSRSSARRRAAAPRASRWQGPGRCRRFPANGCDRRDRSAPSAAEMCSGAMPGPVSRTENSLRPSVSSRHCTWMVPPGGV